MNNMRKLSIVAACTIALSTSFVADAISTDNTYHSLLVPYVSMEDGCCASHSFGVTTVGWRYFENESRKESHDFLFILPLKSSGFDWTGSIIDAVNPVTASDCNRYIESAETAIMEFTESLKDGYATVGSMMDFRVDRYDEYPYAVENTPLSLWTVSMDGNDAITDVDTVLRLLADIREQSVVVYDDSIEVNMTNLVDFHYPRLNVVYDHDEDVNSFALKMDRTAERHSSRAA